MKRSGYVSLAVLGSIVAGAGLLDRERTDILQQSYASREDCLDDWKDEAQCTAAHGTGSGAHAGRVFGPRYYWDSRLGRPVIVSADGATATVANRSRVNSAGSAFGETLHTGVITRGGFGRFGRGFSFRGG